MCQFNEEKQSSKYSVNLIKLIKKNRFALLKPIDYYEQ